MSTQESVQVIQAYFQNHDGQYLAENVAFYDMTAGQPFRGREAVQKALHLFYSEAFSDASAETRNVVAADNGVVIKFVFHGKTQAHSEVLRRLARWSPCPCVPTTPSRRVRFN